MKNTFYSSISGQDGLGRDIPLITGFKDNKYVGVFYWLWHNKSSADRDTTLLLRDHPKELWDPYDKTGIAPPGATFHFNEPLYGYYSSKDEWVMRKHIDLFIYAGVDFLGFDYTNPEVYFEEALYMFLNLLVAYQKEGKDPPKIVFLTNTGSAGVVSWLYKNIYSKDTYKDLWFYGPYDKPLITVGGDDLAAGMIPKECLSFFHVKPSQWPGFEFPFYEDGFPWCDLNRPQKVHNDVISVSCAQHNAYVFSYGMKVDPKVTPRGVNYGRGYTSKTKRNGDIEAIHAGANIQEQWDYALFLDTDIVFVTGWNEWKTNKRKPFFDGQTVAMFVDSFNTEYSRDMEMTKHPSYILNEETGEYITEGYGDNYYMQLVANIRHYKGLVEAKENTVNSFYNVSIANTQRNYGGYYQEKADNFIKRITLFNDEKEIKFCIETEDAISLDSIKKEESLNILISHEPSRYRYLVNRQAKDNNLTSLEDLDNNLHIENINYQIDGNKVEFIIPLKLLGLEKESFKLYFKCTDSIKKDSDPLDYYVSGSCVPLGRLSYVYYGKIEERKI